MKNQKGGAPAKKVAVHLMVTPAVATGHAKVGSQQLNCLLESRALARYWIAQGKVESSSLEIE